MEEPKNKKTNKWKEWKANQEKDKSLGLGDIVESITKTTGIKKLVEFIGGEDCGCQERKEKLNNVRLRFPVVRCFTEEQYNDWTVFRDSKATEITQDQQINLLIPIYSQLFARQLQPVAFGAKPFVNEINRVYELYNN